MTKHPTSVIMGILLAIGAGASNANSQEPFFLRVTSPQDMERFAPGAKLVVQATIKAPPLKNDLTVFVRFRVYQPTDQRFDVAAEQLTVLNVGKGGKDFPLRATLPQVKLKGIYLLRVDCFDFKVKRDSKKLLASQSVFVSVGNTVTINSPSNNDSYKQTSSISVSGKSDESDVKKIRIRFKDGTTIVQETTVDVVLGNFTANVLAPTGGWPITDELKIEAQGLDSAGSPVFGEIHTITVKITK